MDRADFGTGAAPRTFFRINACQIVLYMDCVELTGAFTFFAPNTSGFAHGAGDAAFVFV